MSDDLKAFEAWVGALLAKFDPAQRRLVNRAVAMELRRSQAQRIARQTNPDGSAFEPRKQRKELRGKKGRIKRQRAQMFAKLKTTRFLKLEVDANQLAVGFFGRTARIARIHQEGLRDRVAPGAKEYPYPARRLLGFSSEEKDLIRDSLLRHLKI